MEDKQRAIEIAKNLTRTIKHLNDAPVQVEVIKMPEFRTRPKVSVLENKRKSLMKRFKLTYNDLK